MTEQWKWTNMTRYERYRARVCIGTKFLEWQRNIDTNNLITVHDDVVYHVVSWLDFALGTLDMGPNTVIFGLSETAQKQWFLSVHNWYIGNGSLHNSV